MPHLNQVTQPLPGSILVASLLAAVVAAQAVPAAATHGGDTLVSVGSPSTSQEAATSTARQEPSLIAITRNPNCISTMVCSTSRLERPRSDQVATQHDHVEAELGAPGSASCQVRRTARRRPG